MLHTSLQKHNRPVLSIWHNYPTRDLEHNIAAEVLDAVTSIFQTATQIFQNQYIIWTGAKKQGIQTIRYFTTERNETVSDIPSLSHEVLTPIA